MFQHNIQKLFTKIPALISGVIISMVIILPVTFAQSAVVNSGSSSASGVNNATGGIGSIIKQVGETTKLPSYDAGHANQNYAAGASQITSTIYFVLDFFKYILGGIAVLMMVISGMKLILSGRTVDDSLNKEKENLRFAFTGLVMIFLADQIVPLFFGQQGEIYRSGADLQLAAEKGQTFMQGVAGIIRIFIPAVAVLFMVVAGYRLLISTGDSDKVNKAKTQITWAVIGLIIAGLAEIVVFRVLFPDQGSRIPDTVQFAQVLITITNFITGFISTIAITMIIYAGYLYVISVGGEGLDKAKKIIAGAVIGLLIAMAAFALVNTFIKIEPLTVPNNSNVSLSTP